MLTYAISGGKAGDKITITLKASCDNYEDFTITLNVTLTEKDDQKLLTITGAGSVVYGQTLTLTTTGGSGTGKHRRGDHRSRNRRSDSRQGRLCQRRRD